MSKKKGRIGSSFEDYLKEQGTLEETAAVAVKRVLAWQLEQAMTKQQISKNQMAKAMKTSRSQLDRILDPDVDFRLRKRKRRVRKEIDIHDGQIHAGVS